MKQKISKDPTIEYGYWVEVRQHIGWPHGNYTEDWYEFATEKEALDFARECEKEMGTIVHNVLDYETVQRRWDPIDITNKMY